MDQRQVLLTEIRYHLHEIKKFASAYREKPRDIHQQIFYLKLEEMARLERGKSYQEAINRLNVEGLTEYCEMLRGLSSQLAGKRLTVESSSNRTIRNYNAREDAPQNSVNCTDETTNIEDNQYFLIILVDLPLNEGQDNPVTLFPPVKMDLSGDGISFDAGHVFVTLVNVNSENEIVEEKSFGLYPATSGFLKGDFVPGKVVDDSQRHSDSRYLFPISKDGYQKALKYAQQSMISPPSYNLYRNNCVDFVSKIGKFAGLEIPSNLTPKGFKFSMDEKTAMEKNK